jgi:hypothetical protein
MRPRDLVQWAADLEAGRWRPEYEETPSLAPVLSRGELAFVRACGNPLPHGSWPPRKRRTRERPPPPRKRQPAPPPPRKRQPAPPPRKQQPAPPPRKQQPAPPPRKQQPAPPPRLPCRPWVDIAGADVCIAGSAFGVAVNSLDRLGLGIGVVLIGSKVLD